MSLRDLLRIEDDDALLDARCPDTGYLLWPLLRTQFLRALISNLYYRESSLLAAPAPGRYQRALAALPRVLWHNARRRHELRGDILVLASGAGHFRRDGRSFNRITDYFAAELPEDTVTVEGLMDWRVPRDPWNQRVHYFLPWQGRIDMLGKARLNRRHTTLAADFVDRVVARTRHALAITPTDEQQAMLRSLVATKIARLPGMASTYRRLMGVVRPRLVLLEQGCYSDLGVFNHVARELGIRVAEPQHGMISAGHDAYCYGDAVRRSAEYGRYLPHDLLGYGRWWNAQVDVPVRKWAIGNPHHAQRLAQMPARYEGRSILLLSDGFEFEKYLGLARRLRGIVGERQQLVVRPHPLERERVRTRHGGSLDDIVIDTREDIYESFAEADSVLGEVSTGLFEAIGLVKRVFVWSTPKSRFSYPEHPFTPFSNEHELMGLIEQGGGLAPAALAHDVWATNWRSNFQRYVESALGSNGGEG